MKTRISIYRIKDEFANGDFFNFEDGQVNNTVNNFLKNSKDLWSEVALVNGQDFKGVEAKKFIFKKNDDYLAKIYTNYKSETSVENILFSGDVDFNNITKLQSHPTSLYVFKLENGSYYLAVSGELNKSVNIKCIDTEFPKKSSFMMIAHKMKDPQYEIYPVKFKNIEMVNYLRSITSKDTSRNMKHKKIEDLTNNTNNIRRFIHKGSFQIPKVGHDITSMKYKILKHEKTIVFNESLSFSVNNYEFDNLIKFIGELDEEYIKGNPNHEFPFVDYFSLMQNSSKKADVWNKTFDSNSEFSIIFDGEILDRFEYIDSVEDISVQIKGKSNLYVGAPIKMKSIFDINNYIATIKSLIKKYLAEGRGIEWLKICISVGDDKQAPIKLIDSIEAFTSFDDNDYIYINKEWYQINSDFNEALDAQFDSLIKEDNRFDGITPIVDAENMYYYESHFNKAVSEQNDFLLIDGFNIKHNGISSYELCDLISVDESNSVVELILVKRGTSASSASAISGQLSNLVNIVDSKSGLEKVIKKYIKKFESEENGNRNPSTHESEKSGYWFSGDEQRTRIIDKLKSIDGNYKLKVTLLFISENPTGSISKMTKNIMINSQEFFNSSKNIDASLNVVITKWETN